MMQTALQEFGGIGRVKKTWSKRTMEGPTFFLECIKKVYREYM